MANLRLSLLITFLSSNGATLVQMAVTLVLARLLTPAEIGVFSITVVFVSIAEVFRDFGVGSYLQREAELTPNKVAAAFGLLLASSWGLALLMVLISAHAAAYFNQPGVADVMRVMALGFVIIPFGTITHNLLTRELKAREQAYAKAAGVLAYAITAIGLARLNHSYMALAWANVATIAATALVYLPLRPALSPRWPSFRHWGGILNFGSGAVLGNSLAALNNAIPDFFLGKHGTAHQVGIMSRALSTPNMMLQVLNPTVQYAVVPLFAQKHHAKQNFGPEISTAISYYTAIIWPALIALGLFAGPVVAVLYGPAWAETVPLIQTLCFMSGLWIPYAFNNGLLMAIGRPHLASLPTGAAIGLKLTLAYSFFDGTLSSFLHALLLSSLVLFFVNGWMLIKVLGVGFRAFASCQTRSLVLTLTMGTALWFLQRSIAHLLPFAQLAWVGLVWTMLWVGAVVALKHPLGSELKKAKLAVFKRGARLPR